MHGEREFAPNQEEKAKEMFRDYTDANALHDRVKWVERFFNLGSYSVDF